MGSIQLMNTTYQGHKRRDYCPGGWQYLLYFIVAKLLGNYCVWWPIRAIFPLYIYIYIYHFVKPIILITDTEQAFDKCNHCLSLGLN